MQTLKGGSPVNDFEQACQEEYQTVRRFLLRLTAQQDDLRALRKQFGGKGYV